MTLWWLGLSLIRQRTFRRSMAPVLGFAAFALVVAGLIGPLVGAIARTQVVEQLGTPDTFWSFLFEADLGPVGWASRWRWSPRPSRWGSACRRTRRAWCEPRGA
ncbi:hypothetical protein G7085_13720 [Tessaracoccus sp. HDW20]|uniref:hypothetical protein n=1 Tax=Tessaracoccus coleopterorum TaxID=2714950 RepID=UPI0018D484BB|nr:hypothetical protein [Tessaracoccus coleopterorum]NHB85321.1 hypothetical protein [Tessaracoccus coleopterorum]